MTVETVTSVNVKQAVPFFGVSNMEASLRFYVHGLGFTMKRWWIPEQADGQDDYKPDGRIRWSWARRRLCCRSFCRSASRRERREAESMSVFSAKTRWRFIASSSRGESGREHVRRWETVWWVVTVTDPDGCRMEFSSPTDAPEDSELEE
jgi:hypothetical protein